MIWLLVACVAFAAGWIMSAWWKDHQHERHNPDERISQLDEWDGINRRDDNQ